jgi:predicted nucleic acid-binding protein
VLVLDASVALAWGLPDEASALADSVLQEVQSSGARVPSLWTTEVLNGVIMAERRQRFTAEEAARFLAALAKLHRRRKIVIVETTPPRVFARVGALARDHALTANDASYLHLASAEGLPFATLDRALAAAGTKAGIRIWTPR